jgi:hypothetical protein
MALARVHIREGCGYAGLGRQPIRCQLQSQQGALSPVAIRAVSIDPTERASAAQNTEPRGLEPSELLRRTHHRRAQFSEQRINFRQINNLKHKTS